MDVINGSELWGHEYHRKLADIVALQEDIGREISEKLQLRLTGQQKQLLAKGYTQNADAYEDYVTGRHYWNQRTTHGMQMAVTYFERAISKDARYALA